MLRGKDGLKNIECVQGEGNWKCGGWGEDPHLGSKCVRVPKGKPPLRPSSVSL